MEKSIFKSILLIGVLFSMSGFATEREWAEKRVNQHMNSVGVKMYHQQRDADALGRNIKLETEVNGIQMKKTPSDISNFDMNEVDYSIETESVISPVYLESTSDEVSESAHDSAEYDYEYEKARRAAVRKVKKALSEAGIDAVIDDNLQGYTEN